MSCPDCFKGKAHNAHGNPTGHFTNLYGYKTYIAGTPSSTTSTSTIIYLPDAFGLKLINNKLLADHYANETGCRVLIPDIIPGGGVSVDLLETMDNFMRPAGSNPVAWLFKVWNLIVALAYFIPFSIKAKGPKVFPEVLRYARAVKADMPAGAKLGVCGFCWGGYGSTGLCAEPAVEGGTERLIDAQFCAHPSSLKTPDMVVDAVTKFRVPYSCAVAELDHQFNPKRAAEVEAILREKVGETGRGDCHYEFVVHKGCQHSFAVRANPEVKIEFQGLEDAKAQAVTWFNKHLK